MATKSAEFSPVIEIDKKGSYLKFAQIAAFFIRSIIEFLSTTSSRRYTEIKQSKKMQPIKIAQHLPIYNKKHHKTCGVFCLARLEYRNTTGKCAGGTFPYFDCPSRIQQKNTTKNCGVFLLGALEGTRTPDLLVRSQSLYPAELQAHFSNSFIIISSNVQYVNPFFKKTSNFLRKSYFSQKYLHRHFYCGIV